MGVKNYMRLVQNIEKSINCQKQIDRSILGTNDMIYASVLEKQARDEEKEKINQENHEIEKQRKMKDKKKKLVSDELHLIEEAYEEIKEIFEDETESSWEDKPKFKKMLESLEKKNDLNRYSLEVDSNLKDNRKELDRLIRLQTTVNKAQEEAPDDNVIKDTIILQAEILKLKDQKHKLQEVIDEKKKCYNIMSEEKSKWSLFHSSIVSRITQKGLTQKITDEQIFTLIRDQVSKIEASDNKKMIKAFEDGNEDLEKGLLEK